jgi:S1-C subfamily serine protease
VNIVDIVILVVAIAYGISGFRNGAIVGVCSMVGFFGGAIIGGQLARPLGSSLANGRAQVPIALLCVLVMAVLGQIVGTWIASILRAHVPWRGARGLDSGVGSALGVASVLLVAWMVAVPLAYSPYPALANEVTHSRIVRGVNDVMPSDVRQLYSSLRSYLNQSGFPPLFGDLPSTPSLGAVAPPTSLPAGVRSRVAAARSSTVKVLGEAPSCNRGIEGSGFAYAPQHVLTNAHVVAGTSAVVVRHGASTLRATVVEYDPRRDVAVLYVPGLHAAQLHFSPHQAASGDPAVVLGYPEDGPFNVQLARVRGEASIAGNDIYGQHFVRRQIYALRAKVRSGNSGGPLLAYDGSVLGMVFATALDSSDTGYALTAGEVTPVATAGASAHSGVSTGSCTSG